MLYSLKELHDKTAEYISSLIERGFKIDPNKSVSNDSHIFNATLYKKNTEQVVEISSKEDYDSFTRSFNIHCSLGGGFGQRFNATYYKVHDDIYADTKDEAKDERIKYITKCYEDMYLTGKFPETYTEINS